MLLEEFWLSYIYYEDKYVCNPIENSLRGKYSLKDGEFIHTSKSLKFCILSLFTTKKHLDGYEYVYNMASL